MKKIDFHIHTLPTPKDEFFDFSLESLNEYIEKENLSAIAITNHNVFDKNNYEEIINNTSIDVFPGIEIDIEGAHILVISPKEEIEIFSQECKEVETHYKVEGIGLNYEKFIEIFKNVQKYLIIPHYKKKPMISSSLLKKFGNLIICGEVSSAKKWFTCKKSGDALTPVIFIDIRIKDKIEKYPSTLTYISCDVLTIPKIKVAIQDKSKVHINNNGIDEEFQITPDGTTASTGLNIVMGLRSSGKTYTLESILASFNSEYVKYIKQFEIVNKAENKNFKKFIENDNSEITEKNISDLKTITNLISDIDLLNDDSSIEEYLDSLKDYAEKSENKDEYAKSPLFNAELFEEITDTSLKNLIDAIVLLLENEKYSDLINQKINKENLADLLYNFINLYCNEKNNSLIIKETNTLLTKIKETLDECSSLSIIKDIDFNKITSNILHKRYFNDFVNKMKKTTVIESEDSLRFSVNIIRKQFDKVDKIKKLIPNCPPIAEAFKLYNNPYEFIKALQKAGVNDSSLYKTLIEIEFNVVSKDDGTLISGGEQAEYVLYSELKDASKYDIVLIDEPESSFDNIFLKEKIIQKIKNLSQKTTVFLVTHNSTLGILMNPDKIIYTKKESPNNYNIYTGTLSSNNFVDSKGNSIGSYKTLMDIMEAGEDSYKKKGEIYESITN